MRRSCEAAHQPKRLPLRGRPVALPLGELSPQATERVLVQRTLSVFASLSYLSQRERQGGMQGKSISGANL